MRHIQAVFFTDGGRSRCQARLTALYRERYLDRLASTAVNEPVVYIVSRRAVRGVRLLRQLLGDEAVRAGLRRPRHLEHALDVASVRAHVTRACQAAEYSLRSWVEERRLTPSFGCFGILPDAYFQIVRIVAGEERKAAFALEVDRGARTMRRMSVKIRRYGDFYYHGPYADAFGTKSLRVLYLIGSGYGVDVARYIESCVHLCERMHVTNFLFTSLDLFLGSSQEDAFFGPLWRRPGNSDSLPLFTKGSAGSPATGA